MRWRLATLEFIDMSVASAETAGSSRFGVVLAGCLTALTIPLSIASPAVGIPAIRDALGGSPAALSWIINAYLLTYGCTTLVAGGLADLHGRRRIWILGGALFALVTGLIPLMPDVAWINVLRLLQGMAASAALPARWRRWRRCSTARRGQGCSA